MPFIVTCDPGLEDIAEKEIKEKDRKAKVERLLNFQGKLLVHSKANLFDLHSAHHIIKLIRTFSLKEANLEELKREVEKAEIEGIEAATTFRVTSQRFGNHLFTSVDMQRVAGEVIAKKYGKKVDLKNFDMNVRVDLIGSFGYVGIQLTRESLYKRYKKKFNHPAAIKSTIAYGMLRLADISKDETLLDPMCGSGTIPIEAASLYGGKVKIIAGDKSLKCVEGSMENAKMNFLDKFIDFRQLDALKLKEHVSQVDKIVTNPPYGVRIARKADLKTFYRKFLESASDVLQHRMTIITLKADMFRSLVLFTRKYKIVHERVVEAGGIYPHIFVLEKI
ncbi:MAG: THUMP domain-containing protein [Candidatus Aenigmatarchaeota archaeon]